MSGEPGNSPDWRPTAAIETLRLRAEGGAGGHNGMRSIIQQLGGTHFARMRVGIGRPGSAERPPAML